MTSLTSFPNDSAMSGVKEKNQERRFQVISWADDSVGQGFRLFVGGDLVGTAGNVKLLRKWARQVWQEARCVTG